MRFTFEQIAIIQKLEVGLNYWILSEEDQEIVRYLDSVGIAQPRADIELGRYQLTQSGKRLLTDIRQNRISSKIKTQNEYRELQERYEEKQEMRRKELAAEQKAASDEAKQEKQQAFQNKIAIANLLVPIIVYILGILSEYFGGIVDAIIKLLR